MIDAVCACGRRISVPDHFAGKSGKCKGCGARLAIPMPAAPLLDSKFQFTDDDLLDAVRSRSADPGPVPPMDQPERPYVSDAPIIATHEVGPPARRRPPWRDPAIVIGVSGPALVLAFFAFFLYKDQSQKKFEADLRARKAEADDLFKRNLPVDAWRKYEEVISLADRGTTLGDDVKLAMIDARERKAKLDNEVQAILDRQRVARATFDKEERERQASGAKASALREKFAALNREYLDSQASLSKFKATLTGAAYITNGLGYARTLPGLKIYIIPARVERRKIDGVLEKLADRTNEASPAGESVRLHSLFPPDQLIELKNIYNTIRASAQGAMSKDPEVQFLSVTRDPLWPAFVMATHIDTFTTKVDGKYRYPDLKGGDYLLCTIFETDSAFAEWVIPLRVDSNREIEKEFHNGTSDIILNRNK